MQAFCQIISQENKGFFWACGESLCSSYIAILHIALRNFECEVKRKVIYSINYYK